MTISTSSQRYANLRAKEDLSPAPEGVPPNVTGEAALAQVADLLAAAIQRRTTVHTQATPPNGTLATGDSARPLAYTVEQVAEILQIGRDKVYYLLRTHQLRSLKIGNSRRITSEHLAELIESTEQHW